MTQRLDGAKSHNIFHAISPMFVDFCALIMSIKKEQRHLEINSTLHCLIFLRKKTQLIMHLDDNFISGNAELQTWRRHIRLQSALVDSQIVIYGCLVKTFSSMEMAPWQTQKPPLSCGWNRFSVWKKMAEENGRRKEHTVGPTPDISLPLYGHVLHDVVKGLIKTVHDNTMAAIFTIGMSIIFVFYSFSIHHTRPLNYFVNNT